jgi:hypothetical protein
LSRRKKMDVPLWLVITVAAAAVTVTLLVSGLKKWRAGFGGTLKQGVEATYRDAGIEERAIRLQAWATAIIEKTGARQRSAARHSPGFYERVCAVQGSAVYDRLKSHLEGLEEGQRRGLMAKMLVNYSRGTPAMSGFEEIRKIGL